MRKASLQCESEDEALGWIWTRLEEKIFKVFPLTLIRDEFFTNFKNKTKQVIANDNAERVNGRIIDTLKKRRIQIQRTVRQSSVDKCIII